jgi:phage shock protein C
MSGSLYRSGSDKFLGGVCGGIARYLGVDSTIIRIIFLILIFGAGFGFLLYLILWVLLPAEGVAPASGQATGEFLEERMRGVGNDIRTAAQTPNPKAGVWFGAALVVIGAVWFVQNLHIPWLEWINMQVLWPVLIVFIGAAFLYRGLKGE